MPLQRTSSRANLSEASDGAGLKRTPSLGNLLGNQSQSDGLHLRRTGSKASLADLGKKDSTSSQVFPSADGNIRISRSSSVAAKDSGLGSGVIKSETASSNTPESLNKAPLDTPPNGTPATVATPTSVSPAMMSPPVSPGLGGLHRSRSMGQLPRDSLPLDQQAGQQGNPQLLEKFTGQVPPIPGSPRHLSPEPPTPTDVRHYDLSKFNVHDDCDIRHDPERVDYFSHHWNENDIAGTWRYIISNRQEMANSARLENASWRMWAKKKNHLKTVDPKKINWLKDYDVTWLYGPLYHELDSPLDDKPGEPSASASASSSTVARAADKSTTPPPSHTNPSKPPVKSILKKKTLAQLMLEEAHELDEYTHAHLPASHVRSTADYLRHHHYRPTPHGQSRLLVADLLNRQYRHRHAAPQDAQLPSSRSSSIDFPNSLPHDVSTDHSQISAPHSPWSSRSQSPEPGSLHGMSNSPHGSFVSVGSRSRSLASLEDRHVRFNDRVDQCVAVEPESQLPMVFENPYYDGGDDEDDDEDDDDDDDDSDGGLFLGLRRPSVVQSRDPTHNIIAALPATTLKHDEEEENESSDEELIVGPSSSRRPGFNAQYTPHPVQSYEILDPEVHPVKFEVDE